MASACAGRCRDVSCTECGTLPVVWEVRYLQDAREERAGLPVAERVALDRALDKLAAFGPKLPFPHQSSVRGGEGLRELRPRGGRSPHRALYRRAGDIFLIAAISPEAMADPRGFARSVASALKRLQEAEQA